MSAWIGLAELALGGCTTSTDHLYVHPRGGGDLITRRDPRRAASSGMRFHPTRGSMSLSQKDGGLPPDSVVQDDDEILADSERLVALHHDPCVGRDGADRARAVLAVLGDARADARAPRSWPSGSTSACTPTSPRTPTRTRFAAEAFGAAHDRALRGRRVGERPLLGRALHLPERGRGRAARARGAPASRTARART